MARLIMGSNVDFRVAAYGQLAPQAVALVRQSTNAFQTAFAGSQEALINRVQQWSDGFSGNRTIELMRAAAGKIKHAFMPDEIMVYSDIDQFQQARDQMRYLLMSHPDVLAAAREQRIEAYGEHWVDVYPELSGFNHPTYQAVNQGLARVVVDPETGEDHDEITIWMHGDDEEIVELGIEKQHDVEISQSNLLSFLQEAKRDPTSEWNQRM